jgi:trans-aconitate 2-methyltransferase
MEPSESKAGIRPSSSQPYDWDPAEYTRHSAPQVHAAEELLARLALQPDDAVLDLGCGDGRHSATIAAQALSGKVLGIDLSENMIRFARRQYPKADHPNLRFAIGDASALSFDGEFSVVFSNLALHWVQDHGPVLQGVKRALRRGGRFYMQMSAQDTYAELLAVCNEVIQAHPRREHFADFNPPFARYDTNVYRRLLEQTGFVVSEVSPIERDIVYPNRHLFVAFWRNVAHPYIARLTPQQRARFLDQVTDRYIERHGRSANGEICARAKRLLVVAMRKR